MVSCGTTSVSLVVHTRMRTKTFGTPSAGTFRGQCPRANGRHTHQRHVFGAIPNAKPHSDRNQPLFRRDYSKSKTFLFRSRNLVDRNGCDGNTEYGPQHTGSHGLFTVFYLSSPIANHLESR